MPTRLGWNISGVQCHLSLVPSQVFHIATAVISRLVFDGLQRYLKIIQVVRPVVRLTMFAPEINRLQAGLILPIP